MSTVNGKIWLKNFLGPKAYEKIKYFIGVCQTNIRKFTSKLYGFPQLNCFPSACIHTNSISTISNWGYLSRGFRDESFIKDCIVKIRSNTMVTHDGLLTTFDIASHILREDIPGAFVETGCCKGGSAAMMAFAAIRQNKSRPMHLFDSFQGLPFPSKEEYEPWMENAWKISDIHANGALSTSGALLADRVEVENILFNVAGYSKKEIFFHVGWFQDTVPVAKDNIKNISLLRLDGDLYESTLVCLRNLYPLVVRGGFVIIDDYGLKGCKIACEEYFKEINIRPYLSYIDEIGRYFIKN